MFRFNVIRHENDARRCRQSYLAFRRIHADCRDAVGCKSISFLFRAAIWNLNDIISLEMVLDEGVTILYTLNDFNSKLSPTLVPLEYRHNVTRL